MNNTDEHRDRILRIKDLDVNFYTRKGTTRALNRVSLDLEKEQFLGIVGESGSGKSVLALSILGMVDPPGKIDGGEIIFKGADLLKHSESEMNRIRGREISMIFSDPMSAFDPTLPVGNQIMETVRRHHNGIGAAAARAMVIELFEKVRMPSPRRRFEEFPYMFSGGMIQRAMIADALSSNPDFIIADNPTMALDVTIQAQILELIEDLKSNQGTAVMFITNSLPILSQYADEIIVLYAGTILERGEKRAVLTRPAHPYTIKLIESIPRVAGHRLKRLQTIRGFSFNNMETAGGTPRCVFVDRCDQAMDKCRRTVPDAYPVNGSRHHVARCFLLETDKMGAP